MTFPDLPAGIVNFNRKESEPLASKGISRLLFRKMEEVLKYAIENGMIDLSYIQDTIAMNKRAEMLSKHKWKISQGKDGFWRTYLPDPEKGRKLIKKKSREDIEETVVLFYKNSDDTEQYTFKNRFQVWMERQKMCERSDNTIYKYQTDYRRFFLDSEIENMDIRKIDESDIFRCFKNVLLKKNIPYRALKSAFGYVNGVFQKSIIDKIVERNPCIYVDLLLLKKYCKCKADNSPETRIISKADQKKLFKKIENSSNVIKFAVELAFCTGMRVGELSGLRWSDIDHQKKCITIQSSEKYSRLTKEFSVESTKNNKIRVIPLTEDMKDILKRTKEYELKHNWICEFVFSSENGRIHARTISDWIRNNTSTKEFEKSKSIHAIRRTVNSNMRCAGVPVTVAASILGHTEKVNSENYTYDITNMEEKMKILNMVNQR